MCTHFVVCHGKMIMLHCSATAPGQPGRSKDATSSVSHKSEGIMRVSSEARTPNSKVLATPSPNSKLRTKPRFWWEDAVVDVGVDVAVDLDLGVGFSLSEL